MRLFAKFREDDGICTGFIQTSDRTPPPLGYEEITIQQERTLVVSGLARKTLDSQNKRVIVLR